jgi:thiol-disulfide isomerase/thioredoxin
MKLKICFMGLLCLFFRVSSQPLFSDKHLTIGDQMPDIHITNIINSNTKSAKISDFHGKIIILDFWSTTCSACIDAFPELDSLQRRYPKNLQLFLVNYKNKWDTDNRVKVVIGLTKERMNKLFKLPVVLADTALSRFFVFNTVPHCVWINPDGKIIAITDSRPINSFNIEKAIRGEHLSLPEKTLRIY